MLGGCKLLSAVCNCHAFAKVLDFQQDHLYLLRQCLGWGHFLQACSASIQIKIPNILHPFLTTQVRSIPDPPRFPKEAGVEVPIRGFSQITAALVAVPKPDHTAQQQDQQRPSAVQPPDVSSNGDTRSLNTASQAVAPRVVVPQQRAGAVKKGQRASTVPAAVSGDAPKANRKSTKVRSVPEFPVLHLNLLCKPVQAKYQGDPLGNSCGGT